MYEVIFLSAIALVWVIFASVQDLKTREVANWLSFSLIIFAMGFRFFYSLFFYEINGFEFFFQGLIGLGVFFSLGNLFYYGRVFAGGDAKLMIALGSVLPLSENFFINLKIFVLFLSVFLFCGSFYGLVWSLVLSARNFKDFKSEFSRRLNKNKRLISAITLLGILFILLGMIKSLFFVFGILLCLFPYFFIYAKSVEEACMIKKVRAGDLTEGDWLYKNTKIGKRFIRASWEGLSKREINQIKKNYGRNGKVKIKQGIPFVPVFLISFLILIVIYYFYFVRIIF